MPLYEYFCTTCNWGFELLSGFNHNQKTDCPECGTISARPPPLSQQLSQMASNPLEPLEEIVRADQPECALVQELNNSTRIVAS